MTEKAPEMSINIEQIIENAFEQAFSRALEQTIQNKAETLFKKAFENGSPLSEKLEKKIEEGLQLLDHCNQLITARILGADKLKRKIETELALFYEVGNFYRCLTALLTRKYCFD